MTDSRLITERNFEEYYKNYICKYPDTVAVIEDEKRSIVNQQLYINCLPHNDIRILNTLQKTPITYYLLTSEPTSITHAQADFFAYYRHQGGLADIAHTYLYIKCKEKHLEIPGAEGKNTGAINKKHYICHQKNKSIYYIEQFDIPSYTTEGDPENPISPNDGRPMALVLMVSLINPDEKIKPQYVTLKIFVFDEINEKILFNEEDYPHIEKRYGHSRAQVEAEINAITLPFKIYGALLNYNHLHGKANNGLAGKKIEIPRFVQNENWKVPEQIGSSLFYEDWVKLYNSLSTIKWDNFIHDVFFNRFANHYEIAKRLLPVDLPDSIDKSEIIALQDSLAAYRINYQYDPENKNKSIEEFLKLKIALTRTLGDFHYLQSIMKDTLNNIVFPQKVRLDKLYGFENACENLCLASVKRENALTKAGFKFWEILDNIKKNKIKKGLIFPDDELDNLIQLVSLTELLICKLVKDDLATKAEVKAAKEAGKEIIQVAMQETKWTEETILSHIEMYNEELNKYAGKYQASTTVAKATTFFGATATSVTGASSLGAMYLPTFFAPVIAAGSFIALPLAAGVLATGAGIYKWSQAKEGELWKAGCNVVQAATAILNEMRAQNKQLMRKK